MTLTKRYPREPRRATCHHCKRRFPLPAQWYDDKFLVYCSPLCLRKGPCAWPVRKSRKRRRA